LVGFLPQAIYFLLIQRPALALGAYGLAATAQLGAAVFGFVFPMVAGAHQFRDFHGVWPRLSDSL
jgi:predicted membrane-bound dolichyl-phosphate-mannose-protein mannosyltransferase